MKLPEIEQEALALNERDRTALVLALLEAYSPPPTDVSDEEAIRRDEELENGAVQSLPHDEFVRRVREDRDR